jgi:hypothetical protein
MKLGLPFIKAPTNIAGFGYINGLGDNFFFIGILLPQKTRKVFEREFEGRTFFKKFSLNNILII